MAKVVLLSSSFKSFIQLISVLVIFLFVLAITYVVTRWIAGYQRIQMSGHNLQSIETMRIANNKYVQLIKVGEVYLVVAVGKEEVSLLAQLTAEELGELSFREGTETSNAHDFQEILEKWKERLPKKKN